MSPQTPSISTIGKPIILLSTVDSTNNYAMARVKEGSAAPGTVYFAQEQTAGRGQRGKTWVTNKGENIIMSVVLEPSFMQVSRQFILSATIVLGCYDFFKKYAGDEMTRVKWPNDLYWQDRKAGGILIESIVGSQQEGAGTARWVVAGIGININQTHFQPDILRPVSLKQITGKTFDVEELMQDLCACLDTRHKEMLKEDPLIIMQSYNAVLYKQGQSIKLKKGAIVFETTITGVNAGGRLQTKDVVEREFDFGEVEWVV